MPEIGSLALWIGFLAGPIGALIMQEANFALAPLACASGSKAALYFVTFVALALSAGGGFVSWRNWDLSGKEWPKEQTGSQERSRFLSAGGVILSAFMCLFILAQGITNLLLNPCQS